MRIHLYSSQKKQISMRTSGYDELLKRSISIISYLIPESYNMLHDVKFGGQGITNHNLTGASIT